MKGTMIAACALVTILPLRAQTTPQTAASPESATASDEKKNMQAYVALLRSDVRKKKAEVMSAVMQLDADDAERFWPIYDDFQAELTGIYDQVGAEIKNYAAQYRTMDDAAADRIGTQVLDLEQQRNDLKRKYYERFKTSLDPIVAMRFLQVENQIERIIDLQLAAELPVITRGQQ